MQSIFIYLGLLITFFNVHLQIILLILVNLKYILNWVNLKFLFLNFNSNFIFVEAKYQFFLNINYIYG